jgi:tetratricopeptide (TPR) repeat protein
VIDSLQIELENAKEDHQKSEILVQLSRLYLKTDYNLSVKYAEDALGVLKKNERTLQHSQAYRSLGNSHMRSGNYDKSLKYLFKGLEIAQRFEDGYDLMANYAMIGVVYDRLGNFSDAMEYNFKALGIYNKVENSKDSLKMDKGAIILYNNIGNIYLSKDMHEKAEEYYQKGLQISDKKGDLYLIGILSNNLGKVKNLQNDTEQALFYFNKSVDARIKADDRSGLAKAYYFLAEFYLLHNKYPLGIEYGLKSYDLGVEVGSLLTQQSASHILSSCYNSIEKYDNALHYFKIYKSVSDSLINENTLNELARLKFENEQAVIDNQRLKEQQRTKTRNTLIISILLMSVVVVSALLIIAKQRQKRIMLEKKEIENNIILKKKELATNVLYLLKKNETIESVTKKLLNLKNKVVDGQKDKVHRIIIELQTEIDKESWKEFEYRFQDVHVDFYEKLQKSFPELTPSERKLAAFLKLNMTSKEISLITGQSIRSLEVARYRLRKKLDINNKDVNLVNFFAEL